DVHAAVLRGVGREPPRRLLELPFEADPLAAAVLVPRHGDVDEALVEVPLLGCRRPPRQLELLVRVEVAPGPDQGEAGLEVPLLRRVSHLATLHRWRRACPVGSTPSSPGRSRPCSRGTTLSRATTPASR